MLPLHRRVADRLRPPAARAAAGEPIFTVSNRNTAGMIRFDLDAAGIPYADDDGRVFDFHALRGQFIADLARAGVPLATTQKPARHSDPKLTSNVYTRLTVHDQAGAVASLPDAPTDAIGMAVRTGTGGPCPPQLGNAGHSAAASGRKGTAAVGAAESGEGRKTPGSDAFRPVRASVGKEAGDGIRTHDGRLGKPDGNRRKPLSARDETASAGAVPLSVPLTGDSDVPPLRIADGTAGPHPAMTDAGFRKLADRWHELPANVRRCVLALTGVLD